MDSGPDGCSYACVCVDTTADGVNCGRCGIACEAGTSCVNGNCVAVGAGAG
jgi:hypothetical protein